MRRLPPDCLAVAHQHDFSRRRVVAWAAAAAVVAATGSRAWAQAKPEKARISIAVGGRTELCHLPLTIASQLGYFRAEGLDVDIVDLFTDARVLQAMASGAAEVCSGAFEHTIHLRSRDQAFLSFVLQGRAPQIALGVSKLTVPGYASLADLRGRRIGIGATGSSAHVMATRVLLAGGVRASEVTFVVVDTAAGALAALRAGQIDALCGTDPVMTMLEQKSDVKIVSESRTLKGTQAVFGGPMPAACLYAPADFLQKHPNTAQALASAIVHALKWLQTAGPGDIINTVPDSYLLGDRALYLASFEKVREAISPDGMVPEEGARTALRALSSLNAASKADRIDVAQLYTNDFARRAKDRFKV